MSHHCPTLPCPITVSSYHVPPLSYPTLVSVLDQVIVHGMTALHSHLFAFLHLLHAVVSSSKHMCVEICEQEGGWGEFINNTRVCSLHPHDPAWSVTLVTCLREENAGKSFLRWRKWDHPKYLILALCGKFVLWEWWQELKLVLNHFVWSRVLFIWLKMSVS